MSSAIPVRRGVARPDTDGEQLVEVSIGDTEPFGSTITLRGTFPLSMDGFSWHFYIQSRRRVEGFVPRVTPPIEAVGVTDDDRRLRGRVRQLAVADDAITVYLGPPA